VRCRAIPNGSPVVERGEEEAVISQRGGQEVYTPKNRRINIMESNGRFNLITFFSSSGNFNHVLVDEYQDTNRL
jgi:hypothetical protein